MRQFHLLCLLLSYLAFAAAFPWPAESLFEGVEGDLVQRANGNSASSSSSNSHSSAKTESGSSSLQTKSAKDTKTTAKASRTTDKSAKTTEYDPRLPAGGVSMITPAALSGAQYYKIGDWVTFAWNYTSLSAPPKHVDVLATCSANQQLYTLAVNQTFHQTQEVLWDTGAYQSSATVPLLTETYTLIIYDAASSISATAKAGYLGVYDQWSFGMYSPQPYTPLADFQCATCNGAMSSMERQTLAFLLGMGGITVLTFTWFANCFGLF